VVCASSFVTNWDLSTFTLALPQIQLSLGLGEDEAALSRLVATVRSGALLSVFLTAMADAPQHSGRGPSAVGGLLGGRQDVFAWSVFGLALATAASAAAPTAAWLCAAQVVARAFGVTETMLAVLILVEATPRASRGYCLAAHMLAGAGGYGAGTWAYAQLGGRRIGGWRDCYALASVVCALVAASRWWLLPSSAATATEREPKAAASKDDDAKMDGASDDFMVDCGASEPLLLQEGALRPATRATTSSDASVWAQRTSAAWPVHCSPAGSPAHSLQLLLARAEGRRRLLTVCAVYFPFGAGLAPANSLVSKYLQHERGLSPAEVGSVFLRSGGLAVAMSLAAAKESDRLGRRRMAAAASAAAVLGYEVAYCAWVPVGTCLAGWTLGLAAFLQASLQLSALIAELFPPEVRGAGTGFSEVALTLSGALGLLLEARLCKAQRGSEADSGVPDGVAGADGVVIADGEGGAVIHSPAVRLLALFGLATAAATHVFLPHDAPLPFQPRGAQHGDDGDDDDDDDGVEAMGTEAAAKNTNRRSTDCGSTLRAVASI